MLSVSSRLLSVQKVPASVPLDVISNLGLASVPATATESGVNTLPPTVSVAEVKLLEILALVSNPAVLVSLLVLY